jgi:RHS repeat-associated protein
MQSAVSEKPSVFKVSPREKWLLPRFSRKELDAETGFYYYGARYLNPKTSMWISADPAMGDYIPQAPVNDEAKKHNGNLPGMGGVFNYVNFHVYHYAGNNPVKYIDPDGNWFIYSWVDMEAKIVKYDIATVSTTNRVARGLAKVVPFGSYVANFQNALANSFDLCAANNHRIIFDSDESDFNSVGTAIDILSIISGAGPVGKVVQAFSYGLAGSSVFEDALKSISDDTLMEFLDNAGINIMRNVGNDNEAIAIGTAIVLGVGIYEKMNLKKHGISETAWARAVIEAAHGDKNGFYSGLYKSVMGE